MHWACTFDCNAIKWCMPECRSIPSLSVARTSTTAQLNGLICDVDVSRVLIYVMAPKQRCWINDIRMLPFYLLMLKCFFSSVPALLVNLEFIF